MTFTVERTLDDRFLVEGTDRKGTDGSVTLTSETWSAVLNARAQKKAGKKYTKTVRKFYAPLVKAADEASAALEGGNEFTTVVIDEGREGKPGHAIRQDHAGVILNILDKGKGDRLRWVNGELIAV